MNKSELIGRIAKLSKDLTRDEVREVLDLFEDVVFETLRQGEKVQLFGFMTIEPTIRAGRKGYDPINDVELDIPPRVRIKLSAGSRLRKLANELDVRQFTKLADDVVDDDDDDEQ